MVFELFETYSDSLVPGIIHSYFLQVIIEKRRPVCHCWFAQWFGSTALIKKADVLFWQRALHWQCRLSWFAGDQMLQILTYEFPELQTVGCRTAAHPHTYHIGFPWKALHLLISNKKKRDHWAFVQLWVKHWSKVRHQAFVWF